MTENKQIKELTIALEDLCKNVSAQDCGKMRNCSECRAKFIYNSGYCKRSELVNEIFADIEEILSRTDWRSYWDEGRITRQIAELKKQKYMDC